MKNGVRLIIETIKTHGDQPTVTVKSYQTIDIENEELMKTLKPSLGRNNTYVVGAEVLDTEYDPFKEMLDKSDK